MKFLEKELNAITKRAMQRYDTSVNSAESRATQINGLEAQLKNFEKIFSANIAKARARAAKTKVQVAVAVKTAKPEDAKKAILLFNSIIADCGRSLVMDVKTALAGCQKHQNDMDVDQLKKLHAETLPWNNKSNELDVKMVDTEVRMGKKHFEPILKIVLEKLKSFKTYADKAERALPYIVHPLR